MGNPADASPRLREALGQADVIAAEDTRRLRRLAAALEVTVTGRVTSYYDAVERERTDDLLEAVRDGRTVLLVTDAGSPLVSDPGHRLVAAVVGEGLPVTVLPGPSAVLAALTVAGLPVDRWAFEGFLPRRSGERKRRLAELAADRRTHVFFEAPHRLAAMLTDLVSVFGDGRPAAVCRELTKTHEEVRRGPLAELAGWADAGVRGEITVVVGGASPIVEAIEPSALRAAVDVLVSEGMSRRDAITAVAESRGLSRREVYSAATH
ncbi:MAG: 16S rRNA (cytidine(1402)-2'-O)-methyltransferase [Frankiales bacterium]|nr:16S rRNA (cytidine(1402)-2'-O)-methyltransferase [Frankiales bacterium]